MATIIRLWLEKLELEVLYVEPGSPWENGYVESFNSRLRDSSLGYMICSDFATQWPASAQSTALASLQQATAAAQTQPLTQPDLS